jgi:hypothetical protein
VARESLHRSAQAQRGDEEHVWRGAQSQPLTQGSWGDLGIIASGSNIRMGGNSPRTRLTKQSNLQFRIG